MIKREELTNPNSCMSRAKDDEMTFVLLGRDLAAPVAILAWIVERVRLQKNTYSDKQIREALQCASDMTSALHQARINWPDRAEAAEREREAYARDKYKLAAELVDLQAKLETSLADQRRQLSAMHDETIAELANVRAVAKTEIERLEADNKSQRETIDAFNSSLNSSLAECEKHRERAEKACAEAEGWKHEHNMYRTAWLREIGGVIRRKAHEIDGFVLRTREIYERANEADKLKAELAKIRIGRPIDRKFGIKGDEIVNLVSGEAIPRDEPLFLLRARDHVAHNAIIAYINECEDAGCNELHLKGMQLILQSFTDYALAHPERMKQPGVTRHLKLEESK